MEIHLVTASDGNTATYAAMVALSDGYSMEIAHYKKASTPEEMTLLGAIACLSQLRKPKAETTIQIHCPILPNLKNAGGSPLLQKQKERLSVEIEWIKSEPSQRLQKLANWLIKKKTLWITLSKDENAVFQYSSGGLLSILDESNITINDNRDHNICTFVLED